MIYFKFVIAIIGIICSIIFIKRLICNFRKSNFSKSFESDKDWILILIVTIIYYVFKYLK